MYHLIFSNKLKFFRLSISKSNISKNNEDKNFLFHIFINLYKCFSKNHIPTFEKNFHTQLDLAYIP